MSAEKLLIMLNLVCLFVNLVTGIAGIFILRNAKKTDREFREKYKL